MHMSKSGGRVTLLWIPVERHCGECGLWERRTVNRFDGGIFLWEGRARWSMTHPVGTLRRTLLARILAVAGASARPDRQLALRAAEPTPAQRCAPLQKYYPQ